VGAQGITETTSQRIMKLSTSGVLSTFRENSNAANGLIFDSQWRLIACEGSTPQQKQLRVTRTDNVDGKNGSGAILASTEGR